MTRRKLFGYLLVLLSLIPGYVGFSYLYTGYPLISLPLLVLAFAMAYQSAALTIGTRRKQHH